MAEVYEAEPEVNGLQASKLEAADQHTRIVSDDWEATVYLCGRFLERVKSRELGGRTV